MLQVPSWGLVRPCCRFTNRGYTAPGAEVVPTDLQSELSRMWGRSEYCWAVQLDGRLANARSMWGLARRTRHDGCSRQFALDLAPIVVIAAGAAIGVLNILHAKRRGYCPLPAEPGSHSVRAEAE